jgi:hypothetical protein
MFTSKLALVLFSAASMASQFTVVLPSGKVLPEAGEQVTLTEPSTMSLAVGEL